MLDSVWDDQNACDWSTLQSSPLPALCERLDVFDAEVSVVLGEYVAVYDSNIKKKPKDVFVVLPALQANMVVASQLIIVINTSHVFIVQGNRLQTVHCCSSAIFLITCTSMVGSPLVAATVTALLSCHTLTVKLWYCRV